MDWVSVVWWLCAAVMAGLSVWSFERSWNKQTDGMSEFKVKQSAIGGPEVWLYSDICEQATGNATGRQQRIDVTTAEDERPRFIKTGKVINRFRPLARRRIGVIPRRC